MININERKHRLPVDIYEGFTTVSFTLCVKNRAAVFRNCDMVKRFSETLIAEAASRGCNVHVYLFMPDHLHVILRGNCDNAQPLKAMNGFKQKTGYWLSKNDVRSKWQKDYYDHIIRKEEDLLKHTRYIVDNPVRKGIVKNWTDCLFKGSTVLDLNDKLF